MLSFIEPLVPLLFVMCAILNVSDPIKFKAAVMFTVASYLNTVVTFQEASWFYYAGAASISLLVYTFLVSGSKWSVLLTSILLCSTFVSLLGLVNFSFYHSAAFGNMVDQTVIINTGLELAVLLTMSTGILNGDVTGTWGQFRKSIILSLSSSRSHLFNKAQTR